MRNHPKDRSFAVALSVASAIGYLHAAFVPTIVDAKLRTIVTYPGGRSYPLAWLVPPASIAVFLLTLAIALTVRRLRASLACVPLLLAAILTNVFVLRAELPHIGLVAVTAVWLSILGLWCWIHDSVHRPTKKRLSQVDRRAAVEFVKEEANFYRSLAFGLLAASLALVVTAAAATHTGSKELVGNPFGDSQPGSPPPSAAQLANARADLFLYDQTNYCGVALFWMALLFGPILEAFRAWRITADHFLQFEKQERTDREQPRPHLGVSRRRAERAIGQSSQHPVAQAEDGPDEEEPLARVDSTDRRGDQI